MSEDREIQYDPSADLYRLLGVPASATADTIRTVFRKRAMEVHPDRNPTRQAWATEQFQTLNDAYDVLGDPDLRAEYDKRRYAYLTQAFASPSPAAANTSTRFHNRNPTLNRRYVDLSYWYIALAIILAIIGWVGNELAHSFNSGNADTKSTAFDVSIKTPFNIPKLAYPTNTFPYFCADPNVQITYPTIFASVTKPLEVHGTATGQGFVSYTLEMSRDDMLDYPATPSWKSLGLISVHPVENGVLFYADSQPQTVYDLGWYLLRLTVEYKDGTRRICELTFFVN